MFFVLYSDFELFQDRKNRITYTLNRILRLQKLIQDMINPLLIMLLLFKPILTEPIFLDLNLLNQQSSMKQVHEIFKLILLMNLFLNLAHILLILWLFQLINKLRYFKILLIIQVIKPIIQMEILQAIWRQF
jgi:hypothetical protein